MAFKDFPNQHKDVFKNQNLHNKTYFEYIKEYANTFDLVKHIIFESFVEKVIKEEN